MKVKSTKRMLLTSILALAMCFSMLVGTTFAWFTDSVTSANNIIKSGNLDIELEYAVFENGTFKEWKNVENASDILTNLLWEPGVTEVAYLRVANAGSLALKYQLGINIVSELDGVNVAGKSFKLSDYIMFGVVENVNAESNPYANREDAVAAVANAKKISAGYTKADHMTAGQEPLYLALVVWMPTTVGNEANHNGQNVPRIDLGINVIATQVAHEDDSFDKYYDGATPWYGEIDTTWYDASKTELAIGTAEELAGLAAITNGYVADIADNFADKTIKLVSNIDLNNLDWTPIADPMSDTYVGFAGTFDGQGYTISNLSIDRPTAWGQGLFGYTTAAVVVKNVNVNNADIVAGDTSGIIFGMCYATPATFSNIHVTGAVSVIGTTADGHIGGIAGYGYHSTFENCSVVAEGGVITSAGSFAGGIVGFQCNKTKTIKDCSVEGLTITGYAAVGGIAGIVQTGGAAIDNCSVKDVVLNMTRPDGDPAIGALVGNYSGTAATTLTGKVENVTLNGYHIPYAAYNALYGSEYDGATTPNFDVTGVTGVTDANPNTNNLVEVQPVKTAAQLSAALANGGNYVLTADIEATDVVTLAEISGVTATLNLNGHKINATLNGADGWSQIFRVSNGATFTVVGEGSVHAKAYQTLSYGSVIFNNVGGDLIINGGKYTMEYGTYGEGYLLPAIIDTNSNTLKATTTINGGEFYHNRNMFRNFAQPDRGVNNATLIINGGKFVGEANDYATIWNQKTSASGVEGDGIVIINGGDFQYMDVCNDFATGVTIADGLNIALQNN